MKKSNPRASGQPKIVGGKPSTLPWVVAITVDGTAATQYCGGSLIAPDWVLTAAHCEVQEGEKVIVGATNLNAAAGKARAVVEVKNHAAFDPETQDNDIALVKLAPADTDAGAPVAPVAVYAGGSNLAGAIATVAGWGRTAEGGQSSPNLLQVDVPVITNEACNEGYAEDGIKINAHMLCAGSPVGGKDSCQGDSGGPLAIRVGDRWEQAGIVSFGIGCARPRKYGVYSRVSEYGSWIAACAK